MSKTFQTKKQFQFVVKRTCFSLSVDEVSLAGLENIVRILRYAVKARTAPAKQLLRALTYTMFNAFF